MLKSMQEILLDKWLKRKSLEGGITLILTMDGIEDKESPMDDIGRPKSKEMSQEDTVNDENLG